MTSKFDIARWFATFIFVISMAVLFVAIAYGIFDSTQARSTNEKVAEQRAAAAGRRIDILTDQNVDLQNKLAEARLAQGRAESRCVVP